MSKEESTSKVVKIPKQNFRAGQMVIRHLMDDTLVKELKEVFMLFSDSGKVNPHDIKNGLRQVSK